MEKQTNSQTAQWVMWIIGILLTIFMGISGYSVYRVDKVASDIVEVKDSLTTQLNQVKEVAIKEVAIFKESSSREFVTNREYNQLCKRLDNMESKIDILITRSVRNPKEGSK